MSDREVVENTKQICKLTSECNEMTGEDTPVLIPMNSFLALMREYHEQRADWFDLEVVAMMNAERILGYAYGVNVLLGRKVSEPGNWNC